jgi:hypothetical protein
MPPLSDLAIRRAKQTGKTQKLFDGGGGVTEDFRLRQPLGQIKRRLV